MNPMQVSAARNFRIMLTSMTGRKTHNQQTLAYVDARSIKPGHKLVFYNQGPTPDQYPEQIAKGSC